jgi:hypothetical protein
MIAEVNMLYGLYVFFYYHGGDNQFFTTGKFGND